MNNDSKKKRKAIDRHFSYGEKRRHSKNELETESLIRDLYGDKTGQSIIELNQNKPESIADILKNFSFFKESEELTTIKAQWRKILPPTLQKLALPVRYENRILSIKCSNSHTREILKKNYSKTILEKVKKFLPKISSVNFS